MKFFGMILGSIMIMLLLVACDSSDLKPSNSPDPVDPAEEWKILPVKIDESLPGKDGWKRVQVDIALENNTQEYRAPNLRLIDAKIITNLDREHPYPVQAMKITGSTGTKTDAVIFQSIVPPAFRIKGEDRGGTIIYYCLQAQVPNQAKPESLHILGYKNIELKPVEANPAFAPPKDWKSAGNQIGIPNKLTVTLYDFKRRCNWSPVHDQITASVSLYNHIQTDNQRINLQVVPMGESGILGSPYYDGADCVKLGLTLGPNLPGKYTVCGLIPHDAKKIKLIVSGDVSAIYDTGNLACSP